MNFPFLPDSDEKLNAICVDDQFYSYAFFRRRVNAIAAELTDKGFSKTAIGVVANDHVDTYASIVAIWATGNIFVPLNTYFPADRISSVVDQAEIKCVLYSSEEIDAGSNVQYISTLSLDKDRQYDVAANPDENDVAYILFTSGSTGKPKGVPISYGNVRAFLKNEESIDYQLGPGSRFLQVFELNFDLSIVSILTSFVFRGCLFTVPGNSMKYTTAYRLMEEYEIEYAILVPSVVSYLQPYFSEICLDKMKYMMHCGEALPLNLTLEWMKCCPNAEFQNLYGPTEITVFSHWYKIPRTDIQSKNGIISIGWPTPEIDSIVIDENNNPLPDGEKGELLLGGKQLFAGYLKNEEKNREAFVVVNGIRYYRTGDICIHENGLFFYLGRKDYQVKIRGFRVELSEIEHHIASYFENRRVVAMASHDSIGNEILVAAVEGDAVEVNSLTEYLKSKMPYYMIPAEFRFIDSFPLNVNGKINRKEITQMVFGHE